MIRNRVSASLAIFALATLANAYVWFGEPLRREAVRPVREPSWTLTCHGGYVHEGKYGHWTPSCPGGTMPYKIAWDTEVEGR